jgi:hypothetical protein
LWDTVTDKKISSHSPFNLLKLGSLRIVRPHAAVNFSLGDHSMSYSELARFFDNFHMPLLAPEVDELFLLKSLGMH